jgi:hypothetical protein
MSRMISPLLAVVAAGAISTPCHRARRVLARESDVIPLMHIR